MAKMDKHKQEKGSQSRREFYGFEKKKRDAMDYVFQGLCAVTALLVALALFLYLS